MKVKLRRTFIWAGMRYRANQDGVTVPDDAILPSDAQVWEDGKWVEADKDEQQAKIAKLDLPPAPAPANVQRFMLVDASGKPIGPSAEESSYRQSSAPALQGSFVDDGTATGEAGAQADKGPTPGDKAAANRTVKDDGKKTAVNL